MTKQLRAFYERAADGAPNEPGAPMRFVASTGDVARDGLVIDQSGWQLDNYRANPVILWAHNYSALGDKEIVRPIGRAENVWVDGDRLMADIVFNQNNPFARDVEADYRSGYMHGVSVGWDSLLIDPPKTADGAPVVRKQELLDISCVPVMGDAKALLERQKRALADYGRELLKLVEPAGEGSEESDDLAPDPSNPTPAQRTEPPVKPPARATWDETSAEMAGLFRPFAQRPDDARLTDYQRLAREYSRHKKTAPEFLSQEALDALSIDEVRGLFLEGEPELHADLFARIGARAGAVLSQRNIDDLTQAAGLITGVIERASKDSQKNADAEDERKATDALALLHEQLTKGTQ